MRIEKIKNLNCFCNFSHGATIRTDSGRSLGSTCDPKKAENIIRTYFRTEFFPEPVHVFFDGMLGYTFRMEG